MIKKYKLQLCDMMNFDRNSYQLALTRALGKDKK